MVQRTKRWAMCGLLAISMVAVGCDDDDGDDGTPDSGMTEPDASMEGGEGDAGGEGGEGGEGSECGGTACSELSLAVITIPPCCFPKDGGEVCGAQLDALSDFVPLSGCVEVGAEGADSPACGAAVDALSIDQNQGNGLIDVEVEALGTNLTLAGCCRPDMQCGVQMDSVDLGEDLGSFQIGLGCQALSTFGPLFEGVDTNIPCDPNASADGGTDGGDAG